MSQINNEIYAEVAPDKIDMLGKLIESFDNLGILSTLDPTRGLVVIRVTPDTFLEVKKILAHLPFPITVMEKENVV
ncbi:MAG TPA: DUF4911 domain-containing protein [Syntrophomonadaceae bacterium]|nr:DUF4911 domain-containing protein [Syntrophomonadaceae bacterium]